MNSVQDQISQEVKKTTLRVVGSSINLNLIVERPDNPIFGDFSSNVAMINFGKLKARTDIKTPLEFAEKIKEQLSVSTDFKKIVTSVVAVRPGFINFTLNHNVYLQVLKEILEKGDGYAGSEEGQGKTMIIDYSSPNIAKRFSVGHLRSTIIGSALERLFEFLGWKVIGDNHLGDWGTQFGKMIVAIEKWTDGHINKMTIQDFEALYIRFHREAETNPLLDDEARAAFKRLEDGSKKERQLWQQLVNISLKEFQQIYNLLDVHIDEAVGESFYESIMPLVIKEAKDKKIAKVSQGALIISFPNEALPPTLLLKSDGATTYLTRDLATIKYRKSRWHPYLAIYEVGEEQTLHFQQVFWAAELLGYGKREDFIHVGHGLIRLKEGKMSTRKGRSVKLDDILKQIIAKAQKFTSDKQLARMIGIGGVKYNDLKRFPKDGYIFDWDEILNLEGNSGPYLQYVYARCKSVLKKSDFKSLDKIDNYSFNKDELRLVQKLSQFKEVISQAARELAPNFICNYLYDLSKTYNTFYNSQSILHAKTRQAITVRLGMTKAVMQVLSNGLKILGIGTPEKM